MQTTRYLDDFRDAMTEVFEDEACEAESRADTLARHSAGLRARRQAESEVLLRASRQHRIRALQIRAEASALLSLFADEVGKRFS
jgi:hypothetical protein